MPNKVMSQSQSAEPRFKIFSGALKAFTDDGGRRSISCTASSSVDDLHGDIIVEECIRDMAAQAKAKGLTIFLNHDYNVPEDVFGKTTEAAVVMRFDKSSMVADMDLQIQLNEANPRAVQTWEAIHGPNGDDGVTLGVSIGAMVEDYEFRDEKRGFSGGMSIKRVNLLEASIVGIPANPRSWVRNGVIAIGKSMGMTEAEIKEELAKEAPEDSMEGETETETEVGPETCPTCGCGMACEANCTCANGFHSGEEIEASDVVASVDLPDTAYACVDDTGEKHYPHHLPTGEVDQEALELALSRIGLENNIDGGRTHLMAHARELNLGEKTEDGFEVKMGDEIWTIRDLDGLDHEPEEFEGFTGSCKCSELVETKKDLDLASEEDAQVPAEETTPVDLDTAPEETEEVAKGISPELSELMGSTLSDSLSRIEELTRENAELKAQLAAAKEDFKVAAEIVDTLSRLPLARKSQANVQINGFRQKFSGVYSDAWLKLIDDRNKEDNT